MLYDVIVIGGGVSGLSAAYALVQNGLRVLVVERGKHIYQRNRSDMLDVSNGIGGAGLFSDGKLSMYPSASKLWKLQRKELETAYQYVRKLLHDIGTEIDEFSEEWCQDFLQDGVQKHYESKLINIEQRLKLVFLLYQGIGGSNILTESNVIKITKSGDLYCLEIRKGRTDCTHQARALIVAGGKHCFDKLVANPGGIDVSKMSYTLEIGFRVECDNSEFDYYDNPQLDVKLIKRSGNHSIRTFCCCRDGIVLESSSYDMRSLNGSSTDWEQTGKTNIGILIRADEDEGRKLKKVLGESFFKQSGKTITLGDYLSAKESIFDDKVDSLMRNFIKEHFPIMSASNAVIHYPSIEKDGKYPELNDVLKIPKENIWVAGDATGLFRGLLSAMVSGAIAADTLSIRHKLCEKELRERLHIKVSTTEERKVVFTAQSKQYFYCRDVVCEYVLSNGCIPVNPFRIFDYFLSDRVERDLIRNGNNEMIKRCDELWVFGNVSDGVLFEIYMCRQMGKPVRFFNIATRSSEIRELKTEEITFEPEIHSYGVKREDLLVLVENRGAVPDALQMELDLW